MRQRSAWKEPAGFLGIGEPLIYGVTLPLGKPFITAGLGAGFGGALVMAFRVASTTWGPSGLLGAFVMTAGPRGAVASVLIYLAGLVVAYICSFVITVFAIDKQELMPQKAESMEKDTELSESGNRLMTQNAENMEKGAEVSESGKHPVQKNTEEPSEIRTSPMGCLCKCPP